MPDISLPAPKTVLQPVLLPGLDFGAPEEMYARITAGEVRASLKDRTLIFKDGGRAWFDTFFNGITVGLWRQHCSIDDLHLILRGNGNFVLRFGLHRIGHGHRWLDEQTVKLTSGKDYSIELDSWDLLDGGMLYFCLEAVGAATLSGGRFATTTLPVNNVTLGIVITHYDRKRYLLPALQRLRDELLNDPSYNIKFVVVDNSRNITPHEARGITVLPNMNLGGSGGFMRGLLHLKNDAGATHCLFMDDDASSEVASIKRTYALLQFANTEKFAVAGSLLREIEPYRLFEKGSIFNGMCQPQKSWLDMRQVGDLLFAEHLEREPNYGGWWFFAFAIKDVSYFCFPFFIRGDDIQFAMTNKFAICTMNGIASWAEDFGLKSGPMPIYLDTRAHVTHRLCVLSCSLASCLRLIFRFFFLPLFSYNYATARAVTMAVRDVAGGPEFWLDNLDMTRKRAMIASFSAPEKLARIDRAAYDAEHRPTHERRRRRWWRMITLNGFLLPNFMLKEAVAYQHKDFAGALRSVFRYKKVLYEYEPLGIGYIAQHDKVKFFTELARFIPELARFVLRFRAIKRAYAAAFPEMTSEAFWQKVYANDPNAAPRARTLLEAETV